MCRELFQPETKASLLKSMNNSIERVSMTSQLGAASKFCLYRTVLCVSHLPTIVRNVQLHVLAFSIRCFVALCRVLFYISSKETGRDVGCSCGYLQSTAFLCRESRAWSVLLSTFWWHRGKMEGVRST